MTSATQPKIFGTGLIALDMVIGPDPETPVRCWAGGTCGNVLSILAWFGWDAYPIARMKTAMWPPSAFTRTWRVGVSTSIGPPALPPRTPPSSFRKSDVGEMAGPGTGSPGRAKLVANGCHRSRQLRSTWWRRSSRRLPVHRCSSSIACRAQHSPWLPRHPLSAPWWCSSHPARRPTSSWRKRSHSRTSSSTPTIALPVSAVSWQTIPQPCLRYTPLASEA